MNTSSPAQQAEDGIRYGLEFATFLSTSPGYRGCYDRILRIV